METKEEAWGEYLVWEASIPDEFAKPFRPVKTAFRNWKEWILNYFDDHRITNAFTESFNAKVLFTDRLQRRVSIQEKVRVKKKQRFEEVGMERMMFCMGSFDDGYETKIMTRPGSLGTDLPTLLLL